MYDCRFRSQMALEGKFNYGSIDTDLYASIFDVTVVRKDGRTCHRCKSREHVVSDCPFPTTGPAETKTSAPSDSEIQPHEKCVVTLTAEIADSSSVEDDTYVSRVGVTNPYTDVPVVIEVRPILHHLAWEVFLAHHPDRKLVDKMIDYTLNGVPIGYEGPRVPRIHANWKSANTYRKQVYDTLLYDVSRGRKVGPFDFPPFSTFVGSPLGAFPRKRSNKYRVIHDLSWPPVHSVNDFISSEESSVQYISFEEVLANIQRYGRHALITIHKEKNTFLHFTWKIN